MRKRCQPFRDALLIQGIFQSLADFDMKLIGSVEAQAVSLSEKRSIYCFD